MEKKYNLGDKVTLKSGGPTMTVNEYHEKKSVTMMEFSGYLVCKWFVGSAEHESLFHQDALDKASN